MAFTCPACYATSQNSQDEQDQYCGRCHVFTGDVINEEDIDRMMILLNMSVPRSGDDSPSE